MKKKMFLFGKNAILEMEYNVIFPNSFEIAFDYTKPSRGCFCVRVKIYISSSAN